MATTTGVVIEEATFALEHISSHGPTHPGADLPPPAAPDRDPAPPARPGQGLDADESGPEMTTTTTTATATATYPTGSRFWIAYGTLGAVLVLGGLDANIVATAVPRITDDFGTLRDAGWYAAAFRLGTCAAQFAFARAYRLFSARAVLVAAEAAGLAGSLLCATATRSAALVAGRAVAGVGFAGTLAGCFAVLVELLPLERRPVFAGLLACCESLAIIAAPIVGGALTQRLGWRWCFWINLPAGGLSLASTVFFFEDPGRSRDGPQLSWRQKLGAMDLLSNALLIPSLTALFLALSWAGTKFPWTDGRVITLLVVFAILLAAFLYNQYRRGDAAALPFRIITNRTVVAGFLFTMLTNSMTNVFEWYLPTYYQIARGNSPGASGYLMAPILVGMMVGLFIQGFGTSRLGHYAPFMLLGSVCMPIAAGLMTTYDLHTSIAQIILYSGLVGFGGGIGFQGPQSAVQAALSPADVGLGTGVILFGQSLGPAVFIAIAQVIFTNTLAARLEGVVPGLTPASIEQQGLGDLASRASAQRLPEVLRAIDGSLTRTWYLPVALGCATNVGSLLIEWRSVKRKQS